MRFLMRKKPKILMYHRVLNNPLIPGITPEEFEQQMAYLKRNFNVLPTNELISRQADNTLPKNAVAITFDDGHKDFYSTSWPILKKYKLPASLYITTDFVDDKIWLWPDLLRHILLSTTFATVKPENLQPLELNAEALPSTWNTIANHCINLSSQNRTDYINNLAAKLKVPISANPSPSFRAVSWENLKEMITEGLDVGSHTVSHPILSSLSEKELIDELTTSKKRIETELGITCQNICYPNGMVDDISTLVDKTAMECGYLYGMVAYPEDLRSNNVMRIGRWPTPKDLSLFKRLVCGVSRTDNQHGERA